MKLPCSFIAALLVVSSTLALPARSHGLPKPVHGGVVATEFDLGFELYFAERKVWLYISDHDEPYDDAAFQAQLAGPGLPRPVALLPAGGGRLSGVLPTAVTCPAGKLTATVLGRGISRPLKVVFRSAREGKSRC